MTEEQKQTIERLRNVGLGYRKIAIVLDLSRDKVRNYCKQFIEGRHFQLDEAALNIVSGCVGVLLIFGVQFLWQSYKRGRR